MCHSFANPSRLEYWHIGDTKTRLLNSTPLRLNVENSSLIFNPQSSFQASRPAAADDADCAPDASSFRVERPAPCRSTIHCGYCAAGSVVRERRTTSSGESRTSTAFRLSSSCDILFAPMMTDE